MRLHCLYRVAIGGLSCLYFSRQNSCLSRYPKMAQQFVDSKLKDNKVVVFSKTYCPFCKMAKDVLKQAQVSAYELVELDERSDGDSIQDYLKEITGGRTVPRVFIGGKFAGGGTDVRALHEQNKLVPMLKEAGAL